MDKTWYQIEIKNIIPLAHTFLKVPVLIAYESTTLKIQL